MFQGMTVAATGSQGTDTSIYFKLCSGFQAGLWHLSLSESFGAQGAKHWRSLEGCDDEKVLSY